MMLHLLISIQYVSKLFKYYGIILPLFDIRYLLGSIVYIFGQRGDGSINLKIKNIDNDELKIF